MTVRRIVLWPDPVLMRRADPVGTIDDAVRTLAADMLDTMYAAPGRGLAAPQVGVSRRLFVMDVSWKTGEPDPIVEKVLAWMDTHHVPRAVPNAVLGSGIELRPGDSNARERVLDFSRRYR